HIIGQLQLAIHHSFRRWKAIADMARELSHLVQQGHDSAIGGRWEMLLDAVGKAYYAEHPDALERIGKLKEAR
ncbi:MAG: hypothetical protein IJS08_17015, partial [Victivallales bacterium]|nr:hypothetical protein [Victivallales bacterium]